MWKLKSTTSGRAVATKVLSAVDACSQLKSRAVQKTAKQQDFNVDISVGFFDLDSDALAASFDFGL